MFENKIGTETNSENVFVDNPMESSTQCGFYKYYKCNKAWKSRN